MQAFELLGPGKINYHNEFIIAILAKCQAAANNTPSKWARTEDVIFEDISLKSVFL